MSETHTEHNDGIKQDADSEVKDFVTNGWKRIRRFASKHPTVTASAVSAVLAYKFGKHRGEKIIELGEDVDKLAEFVYEVGNEAGVLQLQNTILLDFIDVNGLGNQLRDYIATHITVKTT